MDIRRAFPIGLLAMLLIGCQAKSRHATLPDETFFTVAEDDAELTLRLEGGYFSPLLFTVVISNRTQNVQSFPEPLIMPLTGEHGRNDNVRILTREGDELPIHGVHFDFTKHPRVEIPPHGVGTWAFDLDFHFPQLAEVGS